MTAANTAKRHRADAWRQIMVAVDGSEGANRAVEVAAELAKAVGASLWIVNIGSDLSGEEMRQLAHAEGDVGGALEARSRRILQDARARAHELGVSAIHMRSGWGDVAESIIEAIQRESADAIVVGRRGRSPLVGVLLGSVSQKLASLAPCVTIVVP